MTANTARETFAGQRGRRDGSCAALQAHGSGASTCAGLVRGVSRSPRRVPRTLRTFATLSCAAQDAAETKRGPASLNGGPE
ncbi:unnamed protein product [Lampetra planeri]